MAELEAHYPIRKSHLTGTLEPAQAFFFFFFGEHRGSWHHYIWAPSPLLIATGVEKEMATHSSVLAWRIPGTGEPGGLQSMGSLKMLTGLWARR